MKTSGDFANIQNQQFLNNSNLFEANKLNPDYDDRIKKLCKSLDRILKESKYSFVVDWQLTENP